MKRVDIFILIVAAIILIIATPYLLTRCCVGLPSFLNTGQIGDTIGGTTAPIIGITSIILLYVTLSEQQRFNEIQSKSMKEQHFNEMFLIY